MATKWKNTSEKWKEINARNRDLIMVLGVGAMAGGLFFILMNVIYRGYYSDAASLIFSAIGNVSFGGGSILLVNNFLSRKYGEWKCETDDYYEEWKEKVWEQDKKILKAAGIVLFLACMYLLSIVTEGYVHTGAAYLTVLTAFIQTALYLTVSHRFWQKKLDFIIDHLEEQTEQRISEALEIERKSLEKVSRSDQLRVDLITNVSHDLKTPLTSMVGYIELIKKEELSDAVKDYVEVISERAEKLKEMINSLFSLAKASSGNVELHVEKFEVNRLVGQVFADLDDRIKESGLSFVQQLHGGRDGQYVFLQDRPESDGERAQIFGERDPRLCEDIPEKARTGEAGEALPGDHQYRRILYGLYEGRYRGAVCKGRQVQEQRGEWPRTGDREHLCESAWRRI